MADNVEICLTNLELSYFINKMGIDKFRHYLLFFMGQISTFRTVPFVEFFPNVTQNQVHPVM